jgi:hypothetical protein
MQNMQFTVYTDRLCANNKIVLLSFMFQKMHVTMPGLFFKMISHNLDDEVRYDFVELEIWYKNYKLSKLTTG